MKPSGQQRDGKGFALAMVLWLVALLSMMAVSLSVMQRTETTAAANQLEGAKAHAAAQAGIQLAILDLMRAPAGRQLTLDGARYEMHFGESLLRISAVDEAGKVDLNFAPGPLLDELLRAAGMAEERERVHLIDAILDWRDTDELRRMHGAEQEEYRAAGLSYTPRNAPFQSSEELSLVLGMTPPLYHRIAGVITIFNGTSGIDNAAAALKRLSLPDEQDEGESSSPGDTQGGVDGSSRSAGSGQAVTIRCEAQQPSGVRESLEAVVRFTPRRGNAVMHHEVLRWRELSTVAE